MMVSKGRDGRYSAMQMGDMGRTVVADGKTIGEAMKECAHMLHLQTAECYHHEQSMSHLADTTYGEGAYGSDEG